MKKINLIKSEPVNTTKNEDITKILLSEFTKIHQKFDLIMQKINSNEDKISVLSSKMTKILESIDTTDKNSIKSVVREKLSLDKDLVIKYLKMHNPLGDILLLKNIYLIKGNESINYLSERKFEYWNSGRWIKDRDGQYTREILTNNLKKLYTSVNFLSNFENNLNVFMANQEHINSLSTDKYKKRFIKELKKHLM